LNSKLKNISSQLALETRTREKLEAEVIERKAKHDQDFKEKTALQGSNVSLSPKYKSLTNFSTASRFSALFFSHFSFFFFHLKGMDIFI
jgi:hypothetical protein